MLQSSYISSHPVVPIINFLRDSDTFVTMNPVRYVVINSTPFFIWISLAFP